MQVCMQATLHVHCFCICTGKQLIRLNSLVTKPASYCTTELNSEELYRINRITVEQLKTNAVTVKNICTTLCDYISGGVKKIIN